MTTIRIPAYAAYLFDLDGTIYLGDDLLPGAAALINGLRERGLPVRFLSNNPTKSPRQYAAKLNRLGLPTPLEDVVTSLVATVRWLRAEHPDAVVFPIAERPLLDALAAAGIRTSNNPAEVDIVLASYDRRFDYRKLQIAFDAIWFYRRAFLIQTNPDRFCPLPGGRGEPDCAAITAAVEACTGTTCRANLGKPSALMLETALLGTGINPRRCLMVGDRLHTDIEMAVRVGMDCALVLTGESTRAGAAQAPDGRRPTYVVDRIDALLPG